jgi:hypothetical protein
MRPRPSGPSDDAITLTYEVSEDNDVFCVEGEDTRVGGSYARWSNGSGVELAECPDL